MKPILRYSVLFMIIIGLTLVGQGVSLWAKTEVGAVIRNWIAPSSNIYGHENMWTWGVDGVAGDEPDLWHFHVFFVANDTGEVLLVWNLNQSTLFGRNSSRIDATFEIPLPRTNQSWRWDWLVKNPYASTLRVENFTVTHYPIRHLERVKGLVLVGVGLSMLLATPAMLLYFKRRDSQP